MYIYFLSFQTNTPSTDTCQWLSLSFRKLSTMKPQNNDFSLGTDFADFSLFS